MPVSPVCDGPAGAPLADADERTTSMNVFRRHLMPASRRGAAPGSSVISRECYEDWLSTRSRAPAEPEKTFQRILKSTVTGTDGHLPFTLEEEATVLKLIRVKRVWPAFEETGLSIGIKGFRRYVYSPRPSARADASRRLAHCNSYGFHEKARLRGEVRDVGARRSNSPNQPDDHPVAAQQLDAFVDSGLAESE